MLLSFIKFNNATFNFQDATINVVNKITNEKLLERINSSDPEYEKILQELNYSIRIADVTKTKPFIEIREITDVFMKKYNTQFPEFQVKTENLEGFMISIKLPLIFLHQFYSNLEKMLIPLKTNYENSPIGNKNKIDLVSNVILKPIPLIGMTVMNSLKSIFVNFPDIKPEDESNVSMIFSDFLTDIISCVCVNYSEVTFENIIRESGK